MKQSVLVLGNSDSGLYDFRKEVLMALMQEGYEVHVSVPDTGYLEKIKKLGCICHETVMERRGMNPLKDGKLLLFYRKLLKTIHPAAVLTYTIKYLWRCGVSACKGTLSGQHYRPWNDTGA